jgi:hypothetical protein
MGDQQHGEVEPAAQVADQGQNFLRRLGIERAGRLVAEQDARCRAQ